jgi:predicted amidohydrolase
MFKFQNSLWAMIVLIFLTAQALAQNEPKPFQLASLSFVPVKWDKAANLQRIEEMAKQAHARGADLIVAPEGAVEGYLINEVLKSPNRAEMEKRFFDIAEPTDGPAVRRMQTLARSLSVHLVFGFLEKDEDILYNTVVWLDRNGEILHRHRKTQMAQDYFQPGFYHPGWEIKAFDTEFGRAGIMICFERQIPEVARTLALDGARLILAPSYGSRGEWNDHMLQSRARENYSFLVFTHPEQSLMIDPGGEIIKNRTDQEGITLAGIDHFKTPGGLLTQRRPEAFAKELAQTTKPMTRLAKPGHLTVASVQMHAGHDMDKNVEKICDYLQQCAAKGVRVAVFPECVTSGYFTDDILAYTQEQYLAAEQRIAQACKENGLYAIVGTPYFVGGELYNMALVISPQGKTIYRQAKIQLVGGDRWARAGDQLSVFKIDDHLCSIIICHDSRYPELVRLPVMKGSRLVFYISWESGFDAEYKLDPYRAQVVARAVENSVYVVQSNAPQRLDPLEGSHGQSRIVSPRGVILKEANVLDEAVLIEDLDLTGSDGATAHKSMRAKFLNDYWETGLRAIGEDY